MGDGKTHINRDNYIHQKEEEIRTLEKDFLENPDVPTAKNLIEQYYIYSSIKMGYILLQEEKRHTRKFPH